MSFLVKLFTPGKFPTRPKPDRPDGILGYLRKYRVPRGIFTPKPGYIRARPRPV